MSKHTPGPWGAFNGRVWEAGHDGGNGTTIADCRLWPEAEANARLMAAAPDLLEACRAFVAWRESPREFLDDLRRVTDKASAAIAKAEDDRSRRDDL